MKVYIKATSFSLRNDTESLPSSPELIKFLNDHGVPFNTRLDAAGSPWVEWDNSMSVVDLPLSTVADVSEYAVQYNAEICFRSNLVSIRF